MTAHELWARLERAVSLQGDDAAIRVRATYEPQGGTNMKVFPPTYIAASDGTRYHLEHRWRAGVEDPVQVVLLDSLQSQAKRAGIAVPGRFRAGAALIARGEFSIVIAGLAVASGAVPDELAALATAYVLIMAILGPLAARFVEPVVKAIRKTPGAPPRTPERAPA